LTTVCKIQAKNQSNSLEQKNLLSRTVTTSSSFFLAKAGVNNTTFMSQEERIAQMLHSIKAQIKPKKISLNQDF